MGLLLKTPWKLDTSEEKSGSFLLTLAFGKLYFSNDDNGDKMVVKYRCLSVGAGKGAPVGANWSNTSDPSGDFENVGVMPGYYFSSFMFPCRGYIIGVGASSGVVGSVLGMDVTGGGVAVAIFGMVPVIAAVRVWGMGRSVLPSVGLGGGAAVYELDS
jgi:hypothetical protein